MQRLKNPTSHTQLLAVIFWHAVKYGLLPAQCLQIEKSQGTLKTLCQFPGWQLCLNWTQEEWFGDPAPFQDWFFWNCYHNHWHLLPNNIVSSRLTLFKKRYFRKVYVCTSKREVCVCVCVWMRMWMRMEKPNIWSQTAWHGKALKKESSRAWGHWWLQRFLNSSSHQWQDGNWQGAESGDGKAFVPKVLNSVGKSWFPLTLFHILEGKVYLAPLGIN